MTFTLQQKKDAFEKLSDKDKSFIMDNETTEKISEIIASSKIPIKFFDFTDSEILNTMYSLQTIDEAMINISRITNINTDELALLKSKFNDFIVSKLQSRLVSKIDPTFAKKRVSEIVNKYGLSSIQATVLENEVMSVIGRNLGEKIIATDLVDHLNISNILAEQIVYELENRVFERGVIKSGGTQTKNEDKTQTTPVPATPEPVGFGATLNVPKEMMKPSFQNPALDNQKSETSNSIGVPRYATEDIYKTTQSINNPIVNSKLNTVTPSIKPIETKYQKDPYREPLE